MNRLMIFAFLLATVSCVSKQDMNTPGSDIRIDESFLLTESFDVPLKSGSITLVLCDGDTLAKTDINMTISIPKVLSDTKSYEGRGVDIKYVEYDQMPMFEHGSGVAESNQVLIFEDTRFGDYDYNDVVLYVKHRIKVSGGKRYCDVYVKPIALGSAKRLEFGYVDISGNGRNAFLSHNVRDDFFNSEKGFINTTTNKPFVAPILADGSPDVVRGNVRIVRAKYTKPKNGERIQGGYFVYSQPPTNVSNTNENAQKLIYFIQSSGEASPFYIASVSDKVNGKLPLGIAIPGSLNTYPVEAHPIWTTFHRFDKWIDDTGNNHDWYKKGDLSIGYKINTSDLYRWRFSDTEEEND